MRATIATAAIAWASTISRRPGQSFGPTVLALFREISPIRRHSCACRSTTATASRSTVRNIQQAPEFVINVVSYDAAQADGMRPPPRLPYGESEAEKLGSR